VLLIEHDMDLVFRFASRITVLVDGTLFADGPRDEIARDPRVKAGVPRRGGRMAELCACAACARATARAWSSTASTCARRRAVARAARPQRDGKTTLLATLSA
jgi:ABC-type sugar transport system ATPase subunit